MNGKYIVTPLELPHSVMEQKAIAMGSVIHLFTLLINKIIIGPIVLSISFSSHKEENDTCPDKLKELQWAFCAEINTAVFCKYRWPFQKNKEILFVPLHYRDVTDNTDNSLMLYMAFQLIETFPCLFCQVWDSNSTLRVLLTAFTLNI